MTQRVPRAQAALALVAGFLVALSMPPWGWWPLAFVGIALFEVSLGEHPTRRERAARGWLFGAGWMFPALGWMWFLTSPGYLVAAALFASFHALAAVVSPTGPWRVLARPAAHTLVEATRLFLPAGGVPLATLAIGQASGPLVGVARIGGVVLLTWVVFQIGFALAGPAPFVPAIARSRGARAQPHGAIGFAAVVLVLLLAAIAPEGDDLGRTTRVALVQGGGPQGTRASRDACTRRRRATPRRDAVTRSRRRRPRRLARERGRRRLLRGQRGADGDRDRGRTSRRAAVGRHHRGRAGSPERFLNAQVVVTPAGEVTSRFDKVHRVPFGEYVPLRGVFESLGLPVDQIPTDAIAGTGPAVLDLPDGTRLAVVISWEVFFGDRARDGVDSGGVLLVNPTNGSSYTGTILQTQQIASSRLRAVETGRWVAQVAPTGFSAFVSPDGEVHDRTSISERAVLVRDVPLRSGTTWYTDYGDWPIEILIGGVLAVSILVPSRVRRRSAANRVTETSAPAPAAAGRPRPGV